MGRPLSPIWDGFETAVPTGENKRRPDVVCRSCHQEIVSARVDKLRNHARKCSMWKVHEVQAIHTSGQVDRVEQDAQEDNSAAEEDSEVEDESIATVQKTVATKTVATPATAPAGALGKRPRTEVEQVEPVERLLQDVRDSANAIVALKQQELQLRREELEFQREAMTSKMDYKRQVREEERRERREQREADQQERLELARIENEKNLAFLKAVMESQQRR